MTRTSGPTSTSISPMTNRGSPAGSSRTTGVRLRSCGCTAASARPRAAQTRPPPTPACTRSCTCHLRRSPVSGTATSPPYCVDGALKTLVITNDFPPRPGGIQAFVHGLLSQLSDDVVVYTSSYDGWEAFDAAQPFRVVRYPHGLMVPTPAVGRQAASLVRTEGCDS